MDAIIFNDNNLSYVDSKIAAILVLILIFYYLKCGSPIKESWPWDEDEDEENDYDDYDDYEGAGIHGGIHALKLQDRNDDLYNYPEDVENKVKYNLEGYDDDDDYDDYDDEYEGAGMYGGGHALRIQTSDQTSVGSHNHTGDPDYLNYNALL